MFKSFLSHKHNEGPILYLLCDVGGSLPLALTAIKHSVLIAEGVPKVHYSVHCQEHREESLHLPSPSSLLPLLVNTGRFVGEAGTIGEGRGETWGVRMGRSGQKWWLPNPNPLPDSTMCIHEALCQLFSWLNRTPPALQSLTLTA